MSQEDLKDELQTEFYNEIETQYDDENLSTDNDNLYENYIKKFLAWQTYFYYLKFANTNATPTGIREFNDENSTIASDVKMYSLEKNVKERARKYMYSMINYMNESKNIDSTKFPLWNCTNKEYMSFSITAVGKSSDALIKVNKTIITNE
jgi:hypothetical protein